jgi:hypothetical protein
LRITMRKTSSQRVSGPFTAFESTPESGSVNEREDRR